MGHSIATTPGKSVRRVVALMLIRVLPFSGVIHKSLYHLRIVSMEKGREGFEPSTIGLRARRTLTDCASGPQGSGIGRSSPEPFGVITHQWPAVAFFRGYGHYPRGLPGNRTPHNRVKSPAHSPEFARSPKGVLGMGDTRSVRLSVI